MSLLPAVADLVLPACCVGCGAAGGLLCPACLPGPAELRTRWLPGASSVVSAGAYDGALRAALLAWKERGRTGLRRTLGEVLARAVTAVLARHGAGRVVLVPVPTSGAARRARGGDLLARLSVSAGARCGVRTARGALQLSRVVHDSAGLGRAERQENLRGAFAARAGPPGVSALVVDDIVTTGTTLREAAAALLQAGWPVVGAATVATTSAPGESASTHWQGTAARSSVGAT